MARLVIGIQLVLPPHVHIYSLPLGGGVSSGECKRWKVDVYRRARVGASPLVPADKYSAMIHSAKRQCRYKNSSPPGAEPNRSKKKNSEAQGAQYHPNIEYGGSKMSGANFSKKNPEPRVFGRLQKINP